MQSIARCCFLDEHTSIPTAPYELLAGNVAYRPLIKMSRHAIKPQFGHLIANMQPYALIPYTLLLNY